MKDLHSLALKWTPQQKSQLQVLDQQRLPLEEIWIDINHVQQMVEVIRSLQVRGAPLIGIAASMALAQSALQGASPERLQKESENLIEARPTAVNLMNNICHLQKYLSLDKNSFVDKALQLAQEDISLCQKMAEHGAHLIQDGDNILTHCNTGALATVGIGTALGVIRKAHESGKKIHVYVDETRPLLQGARLTTWELKKLKIPHTLICDNMAASLMAAGKIQKVFVGCDRIAANGDFANKIGTYSLAVNCHFHKVPFYVVGPQTTVDPECRSGAEIPIENRVDSELLGAHVLLPQHSSQKLQWTPEGTKVYNPAFDVTPAALVTGWILDRGHFSKSNIKEIVC